MMGYANLMDNKRHEADAARIKELEAELKKTREKVDNQSMRKQDESSSGSHNQAPNQTVIVNNEGCGTGCAKGCLTAVIAVMLLAILGTIINMIKS